MWCEVSDRTSTRSHHCQSRSQMHLQSGSRRYFCCCNHSGWPLFHCRTTLYPTAHLIPGQRQHSLLPVWHIHTPAADRPPLLLQCPRSCHRRSAIHHCGRLQHGLHTGCCCPWDEYWSSLGFEQSREHNYMLKFNFRCTVASITFNTIRCMALTQSATAVYIYLQGQLLHQPLIVYVRPQQ